MSLELGEGHLDRIEVRTIGRQEEEPCASAADSLFGLFALVAGEIVQDDDVAWLEGGGELGFDIGLEDCPVHRRVNDPGGDKAVAFEACHKGLRAPMAEGGLAIQPFAPL